MTLEQTATKFKALAHPARLRILNLLAQQESLCVCELIRVLDEGQSFVSRHLALLREAGLVRARKQGTWAHYQLTDSGRGVLSIAALDTQAICLLDRAKLNRGDNASCQ
ncbi:MAG: ArsR/SmtB family transcription factor [Thiomicrospira sp.]